MRTVNRRAAVVAGIALLSFAAGRLDVLGGTAPVAGAAQDSASSGVAPRMQQAVDVANPGPAHAVLDRLVGEWTAEFTIRATPDAEPMTTRGTLTRTWVLGRRFVKEVVAAQGDVGTFEGVGYIGYDNFDGQYELVWIDDKSTSMRFDTGTYHPGDHVMHVRGSQRDPVTGRLVNAWSKLDLSDPDRHTLIGYATDPHGHTFRAAEGAFVRVRDGADGSND